MKKFILRFLLGCIICALTISLYIGSALWYYTDDVRDAFKLEPYETMLFTGHSWTGCAIEEKPNDNYRVLWRSVSPDIYTLIRLKELERLGYLSQLNRVILTTSYVNIILATDANIRNLVNPNQFVMIWRYLNYLPFTTLSAQCLDIRRWHTSNLFETPLRTGNPITTDPKELECLFSSILKSNLSEEKLQKTFERNKFAYREIKKLCDQHDIECIFVFTPMLSWAREHHWAKDYFELYETTFKELGIRYIDCKDWLPDCYLRDWGHVLPDGAKVFTPMLLEALDQD